MEIKTGQLTFVNHIRKAVNTSDSSYMRFYIKTSTAVNKNCRSRWFLVSLITSHRTKTEVRGTRRQEDKTTNLLIHTHTHNVHTHTHIYKANGSKCTYRWRKKKVKCRTVIISCKQHVTSEQWQVARLLCFLFLHTHRHIIAWYQSHWLSKV